MQTGEPWLRHEFYILSDRRCSRSSVITRLRGCSESRAAEPRHCNVYESPLMRGGPSPPETRRSTLDPSSESSYASQTQETGRLAQAVTLSTLVCRGAGVANAPYMTDW